MGYIESSLCLAVYRLKEIWSPPPTLSPKASSGREGQSETNGFDGEVDRPLTPFPTPRSYYCHTPTHLTHRPFEWSTLRAFRRQQQQQDPSLWLSMAEWPGIRRRRRTLDVRAFSLLRSRPPPWLPLWCETAKAISRIIYRKITKYIKGIYIL